MKVFAIPADGTAAEKQGFQPEKRKKLMADKSGQQACRHRIWLYFAAVLLLAASAAAGCCVVKASVKKNVKTRAAEELRTKVKEYAAEADHHLDLKFKSLEAIAAYFGELESFELTGYEELMRTHLLTNKECAIAYADVNGNVLSSVSANGTTRDALKGSIADRSYFRNAISWRGSRAVEFLPTTILTTEPRTVLSVPVVHSNVNTGVLFISLQQEFMHDLIWSRPAGNGYAAFLTDSSETIITASDDSDERLVGSSLSGILPEADGGSIKKALTEGKKETVTVLTAADGRKAAIMKCNTGDLSVVCVQGPEAAEAFAGNQKTVFGAFLLITAVYTLCGTAVLLLFFFTDAARGKVRRNRRAIPVHSGKGQQEPDNAAESLQPFPEISLTEQTAEGTRLPDDRPPARVFIRAFGYFDVFVDGQPVSFTRDKSKEMLAVLVDRRGGYVTAQEMISYLWENEPVNQTTLTRCRQVASRLKKTLDENGIGDIMETVNGQRRLVTENIACDYLDYMRDAQACRTLFKGAYMQNYSWGEVTLADLENNRQSRKKEN